MSQDIPEEIANAIIEIGERAESNEEEIKQLAKMPSKEELLAKLVYTLNAVPTNLVNVLAGVPRAFVNVLNAVKDQKDAA